MCSQLSHNVRLTHSIQIIMPLLYCSSPASSSLFPLHIVLSLLKCLSETSATPHNYNWWACPNTRSHMHLTALFVASLTVLSFGEGNAQHCWTEGKCSTLYISRWKESLKHISKFHIVKNPKQTNKQTPPPKRKKPHPTSFRVDENILFWQKCSDFWQF